MLTDGQIDSRYAEALEKGDETEAREMLDEVARRKGYGDENNEYRMQHRAPSNPGYESDEARRNDIENGPDVNLRTSRSATTDSRMTISRIHEDMGTIHRTAENRQMQLQMRCLRLGKAEGM